VQSAKGYQQLLEAAQRTEVLEGIARGLDPVKRGQVRPMRQFLKELGKKKGFSPE
jgi:hypothetical protein